MVWRRLRSWSLVVVGALIAGMVMAASGPASAQTELEMPLADVAFLQASDCSASPPLIVRRDGDPSVQNFCDDPSPFEQRTVLEFDLGSLAGLTIESATLTLNRNNGGLPTIDLFAFAGDQVVTTGDWDATEQVIGQVDVSNPPTEVDVTGAVQGQAGGSLGFLLVDTDGQSGGAVFDRARGCLLSLADCCYTTLD